MFPLSLTALLIAQPTPLVGDAIERYEQFLSSEPAYSVNVEVEFPQGSSGILEGSYSTGGRGLQSFRITGNGADEQFIQGPEGIFEIDHQDRTYIDLAAFDRSVPPLGDLIGVAPQVFPWVLVPEAVIGNLEGATVEGNEEVRGVEADQIVQPYSTPMGDFVYRFWIDEFGRPLRFTNENTEGGVVYRLDLFGYAPGSVSTSVFEYVPDNGYALAYLVPPLEISVDERFQLPDLYGEDGRRVTESDLLAEAPVALIFTDTACRVTVANVSSLNNFIRALEGRNVQVYEISLAIEQSGLLEADLLWDRDRSFDRRKAVPGTPYMALFDSEGFVKAAWQGFDTRTPAIATECFLQAIEEID